YLPGNTEWVATINLKQIIESPAAASKKEFVAGLKSQLIEALEKVDAAEILKQVGFDVLKDLHSATIAGSAKKGEFVLVEGDFDMEKMLTAAEEYGNKNPDALKITTAGKLKIIEFTLPKEPAWFACFLSKKTLLACDSREGLDDAIARAEG